MVKEIRVKAGRTVTVLQNQKTGNHKAQRGEGTGETSAAQKEGNLRRATRMLTWLLNENFRDGDLLVTLDYKKELRPKDSGRMHKDFKNFYDRMNRRLKKMGLSPPKYIRVIERGSKGAVHHHIVMQDVPLSVLRESWSAGGVNVKPLYTDGNYRGIAEYFMKYAQKTMETDGIETKKHWYPSRGLKKPKLGKPREIKSREIGQIKVPKGYYLDQDSVKDGIREYDGQRTFSYILVKFPDKPKGGGRRGG